MGQEMVSKTYDPQKVEGRLYRFWEERGYFTPKIDEERKPFVISMPPSNITGELHIGHALTMTIQDHDPLAPDVGRAYPLAAGQRPRLYRHP